MQRPDNPRKGLRTHFSVLPLTAICAVCTHCFHRMCMLHTHTPTHRTKHPHRLISLSDKIQNDSSSYHTWKKISVLRNNQWLKENTEELIPCALLFLCQKCVYTVVLLENRDRTLTTAAAQGRNTWLMCSKAWALLPVQQKSKQTQPFHL